jgi:putative endonuclease
MSKQYFVYIVTNKGRSTLYIGVTNDLIRRVFEHRNKLVDGFTKKYNLTNLVYYETLSDPETAIKREKSLKNLLRSKKEDLVNSVNPTWKDLYDEILSG